MMSADDLIASATVPFDAVQEAEIRELCAMADRADGSVFARLTTLWRRGGISAQGLSRTDADRVGAHLHERLAAVGWTDLPTNSVLPR
jgi:hypothetical protein